MPAFYGRQSVQADLFKQFRTGKVGSGTLKVRNDGDTFTSVSWANIYNWPTDQRTGIGASGHPDTTCTAVLYRIGEAYAPMVDDKLVDPNGVEWQIIRVQSRLNADESEGFAVYDCDLE